MLHIVKNIKDLRFWELMTVYSQSNQTKGAEQYSDDPPWQQLAQAEQDLYQYLRECFFATAGAFYGVWEEKGKYVSALRMEPYRDGLLLTGLETAPEHRGKGYASQLVAAVLRFVGEQKVYSHVAKNNSASLHVHKKCGFSVLSDRAVYADGSAAADACTLCREHRG